VSDQRNPFEGELKRSFKHKLGEEGTSFRRRQYRAAKQKWDVTVVQKVMIQDFEVPLVAAIEAKSKTVPEEASDSQKDIYFSKFFSQKEKSVEETLTEFKDFSERSSFEPYVAIEGRKSTGSYAFILHFDRVYEMFEDGKKKIPTDIERLPEETIELIRYPSQKRNEEGYPKYKIPDKFFKDLKRRIREG
jgi:transcription antitermination factor NusG